MRKIIAYEVDNTTLGTVLSFFSHHFPGISPNYVITPALSETVSKECEGISITYRGVEMKNPLTIAEAKKEYNLKYRQPYAFYTTVPELPQLSPEF